TPISGLALNATYTASLAATVAATDGAQMGAPYSFTFTTAASPPGPPTVSSMTPAPGACCVPRIGGSVTAAFSRAMDPDTFTASSFTLSGPDGFAVAATTSYDATTKTATLTPTATLVPDAVYTASLGTSVKAADGTALAAPVSWS